jgi:O-antigen/teichoic acid export membrane protein
MNILSILYEPYFIIICLSLFITLITYFSIRNKLDEKDNNNYNISKILLYTFIISCVVLLILKFGLEYMNKNNFFQKGAGLNTSDRLTIIADDVDTSLFD